MSIGHGFARRLDALDEIVAFTAAALADTVLSAAQRHAVDFAIEELFTNMVKYAPAGAPQIRIEIEADAGGVDVSLVDTEVERFDVTQAPDAAVDLALAQRRPGGLGLHLLRRVVESLSYDYDPARREGRTRFSVGARPPGRTSAPALR